MKDPAFIQELFTKGREASEKVTRAFTALNAAQLNWKPEPEKWSIGQCLDHLIVTDSLYFPAFSRITAGKFRMTWWQNWNPLSGLFGRMLISQTQEKVKRKLKAPKVFVPVSGDVDAGIVNRFGEHIDTLTHYIAECRNTDIDNIHITSPLSKVITYSLRSALIILVQHEHRHINQAIRVKEHEAFPVL